MKPKQMQSLTSTAAGAARYFEPPIMSMYKAILRTLSVIPGSASWNLFPKAVFIVVLLSATTSCRRDVTIDMDSPAYHIAQSEKMMIPATVELPANLPNGNIRVATFFAEGVQKYKAQQKPGSDPATYEWVFVAPKADLYDATNKKVGTHSAGPSWQLFGSSDSIFAQQFSPPRTAASPDPRSIDWLLLTPKSNRPATGVFKDVVYIQRIATIGGKSPATLPTAINDTIDIKYTAVYRLSKKN